VIRFRPCHKRQNFASTTNLIFSGVEALECDAQLYQAADRKAVNSVVTLRFDQTQVCFNGAWLANGYPLKCRMQRIEQIV
jgi:hypothetical protein